MPIDFNAAAAAMFPTMGNSAPPEAGNGPRSPEDEAAAIMFPTMVPGANPAPSSTAELQPDQEDQEERQPFDMEKAAEVLFGGGVPAEYDYTAPEDLAHLGLVVEPAAAREWTQIFKNLGLKQEQVTTLVHNHLRQIYGDS